MSKYTFLFCVLFVVLHAELSLQKSLRVRRQDDIAFPETEDRFGDVGRPFRPGGQQNRPNGQQNRPGGQQRPVVPGRPNNNNNNNNNGQQGNNRRTTTPATTTASSANTPAPTPDPTCMQRCLFTPEYNPVCGTNRQNYDSPGRLECARQCGLSDLRLLRIGRCPQA